MNLSAKQSDRPSPRGDTFTRVVIGAGGVLILASLTTFFVTGARMFTRFPDSALEEANQTEPVDDPFAGTGLDDELGEMERVQSEFTFGLLPSGPGKASLSVLSTAGPVAFAVPVILVVRRKLGASKSDPSSGGAPSNPAL